MTKNELPATIKSELEKARTALMQVEDVQIEFPISHENLTAEQMEGYILASKQFGHAFLVKVRNLMLLNNVLCKLMHELLKHELDETATDEDRKILSEKKKVAEVVLKIAEGLENVETSNTSGNATKR